MSILLIKFELNELQNEEQDSGEKSRERKITNSRVIIELENLEIEDCQLQSGNGNHSKNNDIDLKLDCLDIYQDSNIIKVIIVIIKVMYIIEKFIV